MTSTTDNREIREAAKAYSKKLFEDNSEDNMRGASYIDELCTQQWALWGCTNVTINM